MAVVEIQAVAFQHTAARRRLNDRVAKKPTRKGFNTQPPEGGCSATFATWQAGRFQHTAARRRLPDNPTVPNKPKVSTHSRPKAAVKFLSYNGAFTSFNTQPPEGG